MIKKKKKKGWRIIEYFSLVLIMRDSMMINNDYLKDFGVIWYY